MRDLYPVPPAKPVRLTLSPAEAVLVYQTLERSLENFQTWLDAHTDHPRHADLSTCCEGVEGVMDRLGDRLSFEPLENRGPA